jgi:hypothetical protein
MALTLITVTLELLLGGIGPRPWTGTAEQEETNKDEY